MEADEDRQRFATTNKGPTVNAAGQYGVPKPEPNDNIEDAEVSAPNLLTYEHLCVHAKVSEKGPGIAKSRISSNFDTISRKRPNNPHASDIDPTCTNTPLHAVGLPLLQLRLVYCPLGLLPLLLAV